MRTVDENLADAPPDVSFRVAADVERWPEILPHYRWVRFQKKRGFAEGLVEMAAWRPFPPLRWPTWWLSEMEHDPEARRVRYRHVDGITRGMDVEWEVTETSEGGSRLRIVHEWDGPSWPLVGGFAARRVIGPHFVSHIAGRTLAGVVREAEALARRSDEDRDAR
jgi:ribosome-associated toxin RatA of RatAB toxin-antitoxin module